MNATALRLAGALAALLGLGVVTGDAQALEVGRPRGRRRPIYITQVQALGDMRYRIEVQRWASGSTIQTIEVRNGEDLTRVGAVRILERGQRLELWVRGGRSAAGVWYKVWRCDAGMSQFRWWHTTRPGS